MSIHRQSFTRGSEEVLDIYCAICSKDGRHAEASKYCSNCRVDLCLDCTEWHAKFPATTAHRISNLASRGAVMADTVTKENTYMPMGQVQGPAHGPGGHQGADVIPALPRRSQSDKARPNPPPLPKRPSDPGKKWCSDAHTMPDNMKPNVEFEVFEKLESLKRSKIEQLHEVDTHEGKNLSSVEHLKERLVKRIDELSVEELKTITKMHEADRSVLKTEIQEIEDNINKMKTDRSSRPVHLDRELISKLSRSRKLNRNYVVDTEIEKYLSHVTSLGKFAPYDTGVRNPARESGSPRAPRLELLREYDICFRDDKTVCKAYGTCLLADGTLVLTDNDNKRLKLFNRKDGRCYHFDLTYGPWGVCSTDLYEVAVTLTNEKRVQFVSVGKTIGLTRSFGVDQYCRGICHFRGELYVTCGSVQHPGSSFLGVYLLTGQPVRKFQTSPTGYPLFSIPHHVTICDNGDRIYVADKVEGVVVVDSRSGKVSRFLDKDLGKAFGVCTLESGDVLACGLNSDTIVQFSREGRKHTTLMGPQDGLYGPYSLLLDHSNGSLIVTTYESSKVKEYAII